jgi:hypothetical protein
MQFYLVIRLITTAFTKEGRAMRNSTHVSRMNTTVRAFLVPLCMGLLLSGCFLQRSAKSDAEVAQEAPREKAERYCEAKTSLSLKEQLELINNSRDMFAGTGKDAGGVSDLITKDDDNTGARTGEKVGSFLGVIVATGAIIQESQMEDIRFEICMEEKGYKVISASEQKGSDAQS